MSESWKPVVGFESSYEVSDLGRVQSIDRTVETSNGSRTYNGKVLRPGSSGNFGHLTVMLGRKGGSRFVHDLVLRAFVGPPEEGQECRHINGDGSDNRLENLRWGSKGENGKDATRLKRRKLTYDQVDEIKILYKAGLNQSEIARKFNVLPGTIGHIIHGRQYVR